MSGGVLVLNADRSILSYVSWQRATRLLMTTDDNGVPLAEMFESDPHRKIHSPSAEFPFPLIIALTRYLYVPYKSKSRNPEAQLASKRGVLARDKYQCVYCGNSGADTVDHIQPKSRKGKDTWENLAACCSPCNNKKGDCTPEEAGMVLRWQPWRPDLVGHEQRRIYAKQSESELLNF